MKNLFLSFFSLFLCFCYFNIFAQNADNQSDTKGLYMNVYAFPNYHYYEFSEPNIFGSSIHYGGNIGFNLNEKWSFETGLMYY